jgi:hypothetical protein
MEAREEGEEGEEGEHGDGNGADRETGRETQWERETGRETQWERETARERASRTPVRVAARWTWRSRAASIEAWSQHSGQGRTLGPA